MPLLECPTCGGSTKYAMLAKPFCLIQKGPEPKEGCYAKVENNRWVRGCLYGYSDGDEDRLMRIMANILINTGEEVVSKPFQLLPGLVIHFAPDGVWLYFAGMKYEGKIHLDKLAETEKGTALGLAIREWVDRMRSAGGYFGSE